MIKFVGEHNSKKLVGFGLSAGNLEKLKEGRPISIDLDEMIPGSGMEILIFYGETDKSLYKDIKPHLRNTLIHDFKEEQ